MASEQDQQTIRNIIQAAEKEAGRKLTPAAREMLFTPIEEVVDFGLEVDWGAVQSSVFKTVAVSEPDESSPNTGGRYTSRSIIAAFHKQFCNIPPFCGRIEQKYKSR